MKASFALLLVAIAGCLAVSAPAAGKRADLTSALSVKNCGKVTGAKWVFPHAGGKITGNKYAVTAVGVSCATAKKFSIALSSVKLPGKKVGHSYPISGGPKGYICYANPDANGKVLAGSCQVGSLKTVSKHVFSWGGRP